MIKRQTKLPLLLREFPVVVITGPRQVGKTTLARQAATAIKKPVIFLDMELESDRRKLFDMESFFSSHRDKLIIVDEVQLMPAIFSALRPEVDAFRKPGRFLLTGSANPVMIKGVAESLLLPGSSIRVYLSILSKTQVRFRRIAHHRPRANRSVSGHD